MIELTTNHAILFIITIFIMIFIQRVFYHKLDSRSKNPYLCALVDMIPIILVICIIKGILYIKKKWQVNTHD